MRYTVEFTASAAREFRALDRQAQRRISTKVAELAEDPFPPGVRKLQGEEDHWRLRVGDYRIIYRVEKQRLVIVIVRIGHRREVYR
jgi:mRNA interferase RelE/StbE